MGHSVDRQNRSTGVTCAHDNSNTLHLKICHWNQWKWNSPKSTPSWAHGPPNAPMPWLTPLTTSSNSSIGSCTFTQLCTHNYATKSPLVTMGCLKFTLKTAPSPLTLTTLIEYTHPTDRPHSPPQTASGSTQPQPFCHSTLSRQTDRPTDGQVRNLYQECLRCINTEWCTNDILATIWLWQAANPVMLWFFFNSMLIIPPPTWSSGRRYSVLLQKFLSFFLFSSFATGSPRWLYRQGTFLAQMVGYRCNFKNWVQNLGGGDPH